MSLSAATMAGGQIEWQGAEAAAWADFGSPQSRDAFLARWLALLCLQVGGVRAALLLVVGDEDNTFHAGAVWPDAALDMAYLAPVAQQALSERRGVVLPQAAAGGQGAAACGSTCRRAGGLPGAGGR